MIPCADARMTLRLTCSREWYQFSFSAQSAPETFVSVGGGEAGYLTTEAGGCFTGNYIALFASGNGKPMKNAAVFHRFAYLPGAE